MLIVTEIILEIEADKLSKLNQLEEEKKEDLWRHRQTKDFGTNIQISNYFVFK